MTVMTRARIGTTSALVVTALVVAGCTSGDGKSQKAPAVEAATSGGQLFVATASEGKLEPQDAKHEFTLTLSKAHDSVSVFTDRPERKAGTESLADFAAAWDKRGFTKTPPNAAVVWGKDSSSRVFELSDPAYDAAADTLAFTAHDLGDEPSTALSSFKGTPDAELPIELGEVSVFIDNATATGGDTPLTLRIFFTGPPKGGATLTFDNQTVSLITTHVKGEGGSGQNSPKEVFTICTVASCEVDFQLSLSPGTFPVTGNLTLESGMTAQRFSRSGKGMLDIPSGDFTWEADQ